MLPSFHAKCLVLLAVFSSAVLLTSSACADSAAEMVSIREEMRALRESYDSRLLELEAKLRAVELERASARSAVPATTVSRRRSRGNEFNPAIGVILNGRWSGFSRGTSKLDGVPLGEEGGRGEEGVALDETEIIASANVDDLFRGSVTAALVPEDGETAVELEEAFFETLPQAGLPTGFTLKAGRALWNLGSLNEHHRHTDDFADRPLPYRIYLNDAFNDDGVQVSYVLPTKLYTEVGAGTFRGDDFPFGEAGGSGIEAFSGYGRIGGDIGENQEWRLGGYFLGGEAGNRSSNEDAVAFSGDTELYATDIRYSWAPTGNTHERELALQGEYFWRHEDGSYQGEGADGALFSRNDWSRGYYLQTVFKFRPSWRVGGRYSAMESAALPSGLEAASVVDSPTAWAIMVDWTHSEFSRLRLQYNRERGGTGRDDQQIILQYILSLGAHPAHAY